MNAKVLYSVRPYDKCFVWAIKSPIKIKFDQRMTPNTGIPILLATGNVSSQLPCFLQILHDRLKADVDDLQPIRLQQRDSGQVSRGTGTCKHVRTRDGAI